MSPRFIVLEALDGVGKTTLAQGLAAQLGGMAMNTPGNPLRKISAQVLEGLGPDQAARCLFYASSVISRGRKAREWADSGGIVVMDRYWLSTVSYARARGVEAALSEVEALVPVPDVTVLLTLNEDVRRQRLHARGLTAADRETLEPRFRNRVLSEMRSHHRHTGLRVTHAVDVTGAGQEEAVMRVLSTLLDFGSES